MNTKKYALVSGDHVRYEELRETAKFLLSDIHKEYKFKKVDGEEYLASNRRYSNCSHTGYFVYNENHPKVLAILEKNRKSMFAWKVKKAAEEKISSMRHYSDFVKLNDFLDLGIKEK